MANVNLNETPVHIDDVVMYLKCSSETFGQLGAIFKAIEKESQKFNHVRKLAGAGYSMASDLENLADCWREEVKDKGVRSE